MKSLLTSLQYFVVQKGRISNKEAVKSILSGKVLVNGEKGQLQQALYPKDVIYLDGQLIKAAQVFTYLAYHKPRGIESTLNPLIENNLAQAIEVDLRLFPVGRLDKESEGLMLLTNDGSFYNRIVHAENHQEKEYQVTVNKPISLQALARLSSGIEIMGKKTRPAQVQQLDERTFQIILTQGINRQIRRMCYKLGYEVERLVRIRMLNIALAELNPGQWRTLSEAELQELNIATNTDRL